MKAIVISEYGDPSVLKYEEREIPEMGSNEVLIKVCAAGVNRPDVIQRIGKYPAPIGVVQDIPGLEVSGIIIDKGDNVTKWEIGQEVMALIPGGGYAEYATADQGSCLPIPKGFTIDDAAALPEVLFTVWHNIFQRAELQKNENVLIYGGTGGIGAMATQLVSLFGAKAHTLVSSEAKADFSKSLGAHKTVNYKQESLLEALGSPSMDVILDSIGGDYFDINIDLLKPDGRLVYINAMEGGKAMVNIFKVMQKRLIITGSTLRAREYEFKSNLAQDILENAYPLIEDNRFKNMVNYKFPLKDAAEAHRLMDSRDFMGKIVLTV